MGAPSPAHMEAARRLLADMPADLREAARTADGVQALVCALLLGEGPQTGLKSELDRLKAKAVPCFEPWPSEMPEAVQAIAESLGLRFAADAVQLLIDAHGNDLVKHRNEIQKLAFLMPNAERSLTASEMMPARIAPLTICPKIPTSRGNS